MRVLAIIPARKGSKGVIKKNIRLLDGQPLIAYTFEAARESKLINDVYVATDCDEIRTLAKQFDFNYFRRSDANAQDHSPIELLIEEVLNHIKKQYDIIVLLQPTAPIRIGEDIDNVVKMFINDKSITNVVSVIKLEDIHPARMYHINKGSLLKQIDEKLERKRRQELDPVYLRNGSIYAITVDEFLSKKTIITSTKNAYLMPESQWVNIDTERDFKIAEVLIKEWKAGKL